MLTGKTLGGSPLHALHSPFGKRGRPAFFKGVLVEAVGHAPGQAGGGSVTQRLIDGLAAATTDDIRQIMR